MSIISDAKKGVWCSTIEKTHRDAAESCLTVFSIIDHITREMDSVGTPFSSTISLEKWIAWALRFGGGGWHNREKRATKKIVKSNAKVPVEKPKKK